MRQFFKVKKLRPLTKAKISGFLVGSIITWSVLSVAHVTEMAKVQISQSNTTSANQVKSTTDDLLHQGDTISPLALTYLPEVSISSIKKGNNKESNIVSTTINVANTNTLNSLISNMISRAEVREDGDLVKIIDIDSDGDLIVKPNSIESLDIDFPISSDAKELKIEVYSPLQISPIETKTFKLDTAKS